MSDEEEVKFAVVRVKGNEKVVKLLNFLVSFEVFILFLYIFGLFGKSRS